MKAYFIFAIALTVAYIIYYAVMVARDLYGKNGEKIKSGEEEFDVSDFDEEESVSVVENDKGFNIGDIEYETHYIDKTQNVSEETKSRLTWTRHRSPSPILITPQSCTS